MKKDRARSSRSRYGQFVEDYRLRRLDETVQKTNTESSPPETAARVMPPKRREYVREYLRWLAPHRLGIGVVLFLALLVAGLEMIEPLFMRFIIDRVLLNQELS